MTASPKAPAAKPGLIVHYAGILAKGFGALATLLFTFYAGRHNRSILLILFFVVWTFLPYFGLAAADRLARRMPLGIARAIRAATLLLALVPPAIYAAVSILAPGHTATFAFLGVPAASWLAIATLLLAIRLQRK